MRRKFWRSLGVKRKFGFLVKKVAIRNLATPSGLMKVTTKFKIPTSVFDVKKFKYIEMNCLRAPIILYKIYPNNHQKSLTFSHLI
jgi:hypothetical protein